MSQINCNRNKKPIDSLMQCDMCMSWNEEDDLEMLTGEDGQGKLVCSNCTDQFDRDNQF